MAVTKPTNDSVLNKSDITAMHSDVRTLVNDIPKENLGRNSLNHEQLPGVITAFDYKQSLLAIELDYTQGRFQQETPGSIVTDWYCYHKATGLNTNWVLNNLGAGYTLPPCKVIAFMNLRVSRVVWHGGAFDTSVSTETPHTEYSNSWMLFAGLGYEDSGGEHFELADTGCVRSLDTNTYNGPGAGDPAYQNKAVQFTTGFDQEPQIIEQSISIWKVIDKSAEAGNWTLTSIHPRFATFEGDLTHKSAVTPPMNLSGNPPKWKLTSGSLGFFALRS